MKMVFNHKYRITAFILCFLILGHLNGSAQNTGEPSMKAGYQYFKQGKYQEAVNNFYDLTQEQPENHNAYQYLIASYLRMEKGTMALSFAEEAHEMFPENSRIKWLLGEAHLMNENYQKALNQFLSIQKDQAFEQKDFSPIISNANLKQKIGNIYRQIGAGAFRDQNWEKAIENLKKAKKYLPEDPKSYVNLAFVYSKKQNWDKMLETVNKGLQKFPDNTELIKLKANAYYKTENHKGLLKEYKKLYNKNPDDLNVALAYAEILMVNKKMKDAMGLYKKLLKQYPQKRKIYEALLKVNEQMQNYKGKIEVLQKMRNHFPGDEEIIKSLAESHLALKNWEKARKVYDTLSRIETENQWAKMQIARIYEHQDSLDLSLEIYKELMNRYPDDIKVKKAAGDLLERKGQWKAALDIYQSFQETSHEGALAARKGYVLQKLGRKSEAIKALEQAMDRQPKEPQPYFHLAQIYITQNPEKAFGLLKKAVIKSLSGMNDIQNNLMEAFQGNNKEIINPIENREMVQTMDQYKSMSKDAIRMLSRKYEMARVNELLKNIVKDNSSSGRIYYLVGNHYKYHNKFNEAANWYQQAIQKSSDLMEAHLALGATYEEMGQDRNAIIAYEKALGLDESHGDAYDALIRLYRQQDNLNQLWRKWMARYRAQPGNKVLKDHLIEALHKDGQHKLSKKVIESQ